MKRIARREVLHLSVLGGVGTILGACAQAHTSTPAQMEPEAPAEEQPAQPPGPTAAAEPVKIRGTVWVGAAELDALNQMTAEYQKTNTNVAVEWINITESGGDAGRTKLLAMIAGGDAPDIMMLNTGQFEGLAARGALLDLEGFVEKESFDLDVFWPQAVEGVRFQAKLYGLPRDISNVILFYNKDLLDEAGVAYPSDTWTWDDLLGAAQALTKDKDGTGKVNQWGFALNNIVWVWAGFVWGNGGEILSTDRTRCHFTDPATVEALQFYFDLQNKHEVSPPPGALPDQGWSGDWMVTQATAMGLFGPWFRPTLVTMENPFNWDVAHPPRSPKTGERGSVVYTDMWGLYSETKVGEATWEYAKFLTGQKGQEMWTGLIGARSISPVKAVAQSDAWLHYGGSTGEIILDSLSFSQAPPVNFGNGSEAETIWNQELGLVIAGQATVEQATQSICEKLAPVLAGNS